MKILLRFVETLRIKKYLPQIILHGTDSTNKMASTVISTKMASLESPLPGGHTPKEVEWNVFVCFLKFFTVPINN